MGGDTGCLMSRLSVPGCAFLSMTLNAAILSLTFNGLAHGQHTYNPGGVHVNDLPKLMASTSEPSDVLMTSLDTILHDREVCCGKDSALEDSVQRADPASLQDVAAKLQGRHLLSDGRPIMVRAQYVAPEAINGSMLIETLQQKHVMLMMWKSHLYVLYGVNYVEDYDRETGRGTDNVSKLMLIDTRYSDERRNVEFDRQTDDWSKVQGLVWVAFAPQ
jgi:hypothetical protein